MNKHRRFGHHPEVLKAEEDSWLASKAIWNNPDSPTEEEEVAAKNARLAAKISKQKELAGATSVQDG